MSTAGQSQWSGKNTTNEKHNNQTYSDLLPFVLLFSDTTSTISFKETNNMIDGQNALQSNDRGRRLRQQ